MRTHEGKWALTILFIVLLAYVLPYTVFTNIEKWYGSFLLWIILTVIVIIITYFFTKDWGNEE
ncbi:hypothetical protein D8M04_00470 [Oceanobacillus piezotolerans]|uniref:DUF3311 domain-containing protein n=1 Tax=Oceanobacillus piezotolerans TaxID=2448030 RepID=A0A498DH18_9BACI|nr:hypothetical protein [Oceanobacillus piezotolerans]RLL47789.1 hypothetical protein D8M04_00470 [Oceanobacillus piezotolerans]